MVATTTVDHQIPQVCEVVSPTRSRATSQVGFFTRWSSRAPIAPPVTPSTALSISSAVATSNTATTYRDSCDRCEELKIQSDINQSMLNECATGLKAREAELGALKDLNRELQIQLDSANQANTQLSLEQVRFKHELQSKDKQLAVQVVESTLHANTCNELTAQLVQQYKVLADAHMQGKERADAVHTAHQQEVATIEAKLEAKDQELMCIKGELEAQAPRATSLNQSLTRRSRSLQISFIVSIEALRKRPLSVPQSLIPNAMSSSVICSQSYVLVSKSCKLRIQSFTLNSQLKKTWISRQTIWKT